MFGSQPSGRACDFRSCPPPGGGCGWPCGRMKRFSNRSLRRRPCRRTKRFSDRSLRRSAIVRIATFADGGRTSGARLACEPAVRHMGRRRTAHAARDLFSALRQSAAAGCRPLTRSRLSPEKQHAPNASPPQKTESPERLDKALGRFRIYHTAAARDDRVSACGPPWPRCTPWRAAPSSGAPSGSVFPSSCRCRTSCCRCARGPSRGCG